MTVYYLTIYSNHHRNMLNVVSSHKYPNIQMIGRTVIVVSDVNCFYSLAT